MTQTRHMQRCIQPEVPRAQALGTLAANPWVCPAGRMAAGQIFIGPSFGSGELWSIVFISAAAGFREIFIPVCLTSPAPASQAESQFQEKTMSRISRNVQIIPQVLRDTSRWSTLLLTWEVS